MLSQSDGECHPTIEQIRDDLGLYSASMVFEALAHLEDLGFITRERHAFPGVRAKRNVYRRTPCGFTVLRLLERNIITGEMRPVRHAEMPTAEESRELVQKGLEALLGDEYPRYAQASQESKRAILIDLLGASPKLPAQ
jgi:DNA-binding PadR family transcriptional regulator